MGLSRQVKKQPKISVAETAAGPAVAHAPAPMERAKVLVVDDDRRNLQAISVVLEETAEIVCASSGEEALRFLLKDEFPWPASSVIPNDALPDTLNEFFELLGRESRSSLAGQWSLRV